LGVLCEASHFSKEKPFAKKSQQRIARLINGCRQKWKLMLRRPLGRPKNRWEGDIMTDIKKLKIKNWTNCIQDRKNWKFYVERTKNFKELKL
jgi:hypothetical protein